MLCPLMKQVRNMGATTLGAVERLEREDGGGDYEMGGARRCVMIAIDICLFDPYSMIMIGPNRLETGERIEMQAGNGVPLSMKRGKDSAGPTLYADLGLKKGWRGRAALPRFKPGGRGEGEREGQKGARIWLGEVREVRITSYHIPIYWSLPRLFLFLSPVTASPVLCGSLTPPPGSTKVTSHLVLPSPISSPPLLPSTPSSQTRATRGHPLPPPSAPLSLLPHTLIALHPPSIIPPTYPHIPSPSWPMLHSPSCPATTPRKTKKTARSASSLSPSASVYPERNPISCPSVAMPSTK